MRALWFRTTSIAVAAAVLGPVLATVEATPATAIEVPPPFVYTGQAQYWTVPPGVTSIYAELQGATGGAAGGLPSGGLGGRVTATVAVTPGTTLQIDAGGAGSDSHCSGGQADGGWNGGGLSPPGWNNGCSGGGGGGASDIKLVGATLVIAGGGGGAGQSANTLNGAGGSGGGQDGSGQAGGTGNSSQAGWPPGSPGFGGPAGPPAPAPTNGAQPGVGANAGTSGSCGTGSGGGGGGGYFGGGAGQRTCYGVSAGGGGGSSWAGPSAAGVAMIRGYQAGHGRVAITYAAPASAAPTAGSATFAYTGNVQAWTVPEGVTAVLVDALGATGGGGGGGGGRMVAAVPVTPGAVLELMVGGAGTYVNTGSPGGFNGGGAAGGGTTGAAGGGGGASDVRIAGLQPQDRVVVAAGGGGIGSRGGVGGAGGGLSGVPGGPGQTGFGWAPGPPGFGGPPGPPAAAPTNGALLGQGGNGFTGSCGRDPSGGGGGGYYGGGGGGGACYTVAPGGGGGSSWADPAIAIGAVTTSGVNAGNGQIQISWPVVRDLTAALGSDPYGERVGNVHIGSGNLVADQSDVSIKTAGPGLGLERSYNSLDTVTGAFGIGWNSTYEIRAALDVPTGNITLTYPDGRRELHTRGADGTFMPPPGFTSKLTTVGGGGWVLTHKDRSVETFGADGRLLAQVDDYGRALSFGYSASQLTTVSDNRGRSLTFGWTGTHITSVSTSAVDGPGYSGPLTWRYGYSGDRLVRVCDPRDSDLVSGYCTVFGYGPNGKLTSVTRPKGNVSLRVGYGTNDRVSWTEDGARNRTTFTYVDGLTVVTDPGDSPTSYFYDLLWRTTRVVDADNGVLSYTYDANGFRNSVTDPLANKVSMAYDARGNLRSRTDAENYTTWFGFDSQDNLADRRDPRSASATDDTYRTTFTYNGAGDELTETSPPTAEFPAGVTQTTTYTSGTEDFGWGVVPPGLVRSTNPGRGGDTVYEYDAVGDLRKTVEPSGLVLTFSYDALGRSLGANSTWESGSATTTTTYDQLGNPLVVTEPAATDTASFPSVVHRRRTTNTYDRNANTSSTVVDDIGGSPAPTPASTTGYEYDDADRMWRQTDAESGRTTRTFDANSNVDSVTDAEGRTFRTDYDKLNRPVELRLLDFVDDPIGGGPPREVVLSRDRYDASGRRIGEFRPAPGTGGRAGQLDPATTAMREFRIAYDRADRQLSRTLIGYRSRAGVTPAVRDIELESAVYDAAGNVITQSSGGGIRRLTNAYDQAGLLSSSTTELGTDDRVTTYAHDEVGDVTRITATRGSSTSEVRRGYDPTTNRLADETVENGAIDLITTFAYDQRGLRTSTVDPRGNLAGATAANFRTDATYDGLGRLVQTISPPVTVENTGGSPATARPTVTNGYDAVGNQAVVVDARGSRTTTTFDRLDRRVRIDHPAYTPSGGATLTPFEAFAYDRVGNLTSMTSRRGQSTDYLFDGRNRVVRQLDPLVSGEAARGVTLTTYDDAGNRASVTEPTGAQTGFGFDDLDRLRTSAVVVRQAAPAGVFTTTNDYDDVGNPVYIADPTGVSSQASFNGAGERTSTTDALGKTTSFTYDVAGRVLTSTDPLGRRTQHVYDPAGRETSTLAVDANSATVLATSYASFDAAGNRTAAHSARSSGPADTTYLTTFGYDALNRNTSVIEPGSGTPVTTSFGYDANGNLTRNTDGRGNATTYTYNAWNLRSSTVEPSTTAHPALVERTFTTAFDAGGLPVTETQPGTTVTRSFDELARMRSEAGSGSGIAGASRSFGYDLAGRRTSVSHPSGTIGLGYDDRGLLLSATVPGSLSLASSFLYDGAGRMTRRNDAAGTASYTYTPRGELDVQTDPLTGVGADHDWNDAGQLSSVTYATSPATTRSYEYDTTGRLDLDTLRAGTTILAATDYGYNPDDDVTSQTITAPGNAGAGSHSYAYDRSGRLASWTKGSTTTTYAYDGSGNRTQAGSSTYTYDQRNRMTTGPTAGQGATSYTWTARGTLAGAKVKNKTTAVAFDALGRQSAYGAVTYSYDSLDRLVARSGTSLTYPGTEVDPDAFGAEQYSRSPSGDLEAVKKGTTARLIGENRHGDVAWMLSAAGAVTDTRAWDPYGASAGSSGSTAISLGYQGDFTDPTTGLVDMGARWYSPTTATFTSRDSEFGELGSPISLNRYTYANGDPLGFFDPDGRRGLNLKKWAEDRLKGAINTGKTAVRGATNLTGGVIDTAQDLTSATVQATASTVGTISRTLANTATTLKRRANRLAAATVRTTVAAAQVTGRGVANVARACAGSSACRTAAVSVAVAAVAVACTACAVGAAIGTGIGGGVGLATCGGDAGCVARSAVTGAAGGVAAPFGGAWGGAALSGLSGGLAGQATAGKFSRNGLIRDVGVSLLTAGALRYGGKAVAGARSSLAPSGGLRSGGRIQGQEGSIPWPGGGAPEDSLAAARAARNAKAVEVGSSKATVTGGYGMNGVPRAGCNSNPIGCAEDDVARQIGGDPGDINFTEAIRPRTGEQVPICWSCQGKYDPSQFPPGTEWKPGGPWDTR